MTFTASELQSGLSAASAVVAAARDKLGDLSADETAAIDMVEFAALIDPGLAPVAALAPAVALFVNWVAAHNRSAAPGSQMRIDYGRRASDPNLPTGEPAS